MKIAVIGVGGTGCSTALMLAKLQHSIAIIDNDVIETNNLNRQILYTKKDIGLHKVEVAQKKLQEGEGIKVKIMKRRLSEENADELLKDFQLILDCTDNYEARAAIEKHCKKFQKTWIFASAFENEGMVATLTPKSKRFEKFAKNPEICFECGRSTTATICSFISAIQVQEAVNVLKGKPRLEGKLLYADLKNIQFKTLKV